MRAQFCPLDSCNQRADAKRGLCPTHWGLVPVDLKMAVEREADRKGNAYGPALMRAIMAVDALERDAA